MKNHIGKIKIKDKVYTADLQTDLQSKFLVKILELPFANMQIIDIAIGFFENLGEVTFVSGMTSFGSDGVMPVQIFNFEYLIKGHQFSKIEDIQANILNFESEILKKVFSDTVLGMDGISDDLPKKPVKLIESEQVKISYYNGLRKSYKREMAFTANQYKYIHIRRLGGAIPIWDLLQIAGRFKKLIFLLGFSDAANVDQFSFILYNSREKIRFQLFGWKYKIEKIKINFFVNHNINFLEIFSSELIEKWVFNEDYQELFDILFERHFLKQMSRESSFLNTAFALERFHRNHVAKKSSFENRVKYFESIFNSILPDDIDVRNYMNRIEITRHSISHFEDKPQAFKGIDLLYASVYIEVVIIISMIKHLGVSEENVNSLTLYTKQFIRDRYYHNKSLRCNYPSKIFNNE